MGARPGPGFPACPGTGPAKGALAVGGGWGLAFPALLLRPPQSGGRKCRAPFPPATNAVGSQSLSPYALFPVACPAGACQEKGPLHLRPTD